MLNIITGFHRSGTSCVAGMAFRNGVPMGPEKDMIMGLPDNPKGHYELKPYVELNDALLRINGGTWDNPGPEIKISSPGWFFETATRLHERYGSPLTVKDPRFSLTLPYWRQHYQDHLKVVIMIRNPFQAVESIMIRNPGRFTSDQVHALYTLYLGKVRLLVDTFSISHLILDYQDFLSEDPHQTSKIFIEFLKSQEVEIIDYSFIETLLWRNCRRLQDPQTAAEERSVKIYLELFARRERQRSLR